MPTKEKLYTGTLRVVIKDKPERTISNIVELKMSERGSYVKMSREIQKALHEGQVIEIHTPPW